MKNTKEDKWILVSCLQKSIRKGFTELAQSYAEKLYELERSYLLYRLSIIAIEDIGLGNIKLVHDFLSTEIRKANIEDRGGKDYVLSVVRDLCESVKDRSACDLVSLASFYQEKTNINKSHEEIFIDDQSPVVNRVLAGWEILGAKTLKNPLVKNSENNDLDRFLELNRQIVNDPIIIETIKFAHKIHREPHFISLGLLSYLYNKEKDNKMKIGKFETGQYVEKKYPILMVQNKWLIDGIDWHTKEGKSAIYDFCNENNELIKYLKTMVIDKETIASIVGMLLFRQNGHQVDKRLVYPTAIVILKMTEKMTFKEITVNENADFFKALSLIEPVIPNLNKYIEKKFTTADPQYFPF